MTTTLTSRFHTIEKDSSAYEAGLVSLYLGPKLTDHKFTGTYELRLNFNKPYQTSHIQKLPLAIKDALLVGEIAAWPTNEGGTTIAVHSSAPDDLWEAIEDNITFEDAQLESCKEWMNEVMGDILEQYEIPSNEIDASSHEYPHKGQLAELGMQENPSFDPNAPQTDPDAQKRYQMTISLKHPESGNMSGLSALQDIASDIRSTYAHHIILRPASSGSSEEKPQIQLQTNNPLELVHQLIDDHQLVPEGKRRYHLTRAKELIRNTEKGANNLFHLPTPGGEGLQR